MMNSPDRPVEVKEWIALRLYELTQPASAEALTAALRARAPGVRLLFPTLAANGEIPADHPLSVFVFVELDRPIKLLLDLTKCDKVESVISVQTKPAQFTNDELQKLVARCRKAKLKAGHKIHIPRGDYKGLEVEVIRTNQDEETADVFLRLHSKRKVLTLPLADLV